MGFFDSALHGILNVDDLTVLRDRMIPVAGRVVYLKGHTSDGLGEGVFEWIVGAPGGDDDGININSSLSGAGYWKRRAWTFVFPEMFGALGSDDAADSDGFTRAINYLNGEGGGEIRCLGKQYNVGDVELKSGVRIAGQMASMGNLSGFHGTKLLLAAGADHIFDTPVAAQTNIGLENLFFYGDNAAVNDVAGLNLRDVSRSQFRALAFSSFSGSAIQILAGAASRFEHVFAQNCLLDRTQAVARGVVELGGTDHWMSDCELTASSSIEGDISDANLYIAALHATGANHFIRDNVLEISDVGMRLAADLCRLSGNRCDLNYGHGKVTTGNSNQIANALCYRNGRAATDTYSHFLTSGVNNVFTAPKAVSLGGDAWKAKYGFEDTVSSATTRNEYINPRSSQHVTAAFSLGYYGGSIQLPRHTASPVADLDTTPDVEQQTSFRLQNTGATTITNFDNGFTGQEITLIASNANTTIANNGNIKNRSGVNDLLAQWEGRRYVKDIGGAWIET